MQQLMSQIKEKDRKKSIKLRVNSIEVDIAKESRLYFKRMQSISSKRNLQIFTPYNKYYQSINIDSLNKLQSLHHKHPELNIQPSIDSNEEYISQLTNEKLQQRGIDKDKDMLRSISLCRSLSDNSKQRQIRNAQRELCIGRYASFNEQKVKQKQKLPIVFIKSLMAESELNHIKNSRFRNQICRIVMKKQEEQRKVKTQKERVLSNLQKYNQSSTLKGNVDLLGPVSLSINLPYLNKSINMSKSFYRKGVLQKQLQRNLVLREKEKKQTNDSYSAKKKRNKTEEISPWSVPQQQVTSEQFY